VAKSSVPDRLKIELEVMARRITMLLNAIREMARPDDADVILYERLVKRTDGLCELIAAIESTLDGI
jgi:hypothetical protein